MSPDPAWILRTVCKLRPDLRNARIRTEKGPAMYLTADLGERAVCVAAISSMVGAWTDGMVLHALLQGLPK